MLTGGRGDDRLIGGEGDDTYVFNRGDGIDTIEDSPTTNAGNRIQFGLGIVQSDLSFVQDEAARTLKIQVGSSGNDKLVLTSFDPTGTNGSLVVETLEFANGTTASLAALFAPPVNNMPTVAHPLTDRTVQEDLPLTLQIPADAFADEDVGDQLTLSASLADGHALPAWLTFNPTTQTFSGTPDDAQVGSFDLKVTATDIGNLSTSDVFTLTITNVSEAPTLAVPLADQQATEDAPFSLIVPANTFADIDQGDLLTYSAMLASGSLLPTWLAFDSTTRTLSGTPLNSDVGALNIAVHATDRGGLSATDTFALTIQNVNDVPTVAVPLTDQTVSEDTLLHVVVPTSTFADQDIDDVLTFSANLANGAALPTWLSFNATTRTFSGTPDNAQVGSLDLRVTATDTGKLTASDVFALRVINVNDAPTVANPLVDQTVSEDAPFSIQVSSNAFADEDAGDVLTYSASLANGAALPSWLNFNAATRTLSGTPDDAQIGNLDLRITATDTGNVTASDVFTLAVTNVNEAPIVTVPLADQQATQGTAFNFVVPENTFADVDPGDHLIYSTSLANGTPLPSWLSFNASTRTLNGMPQGGDVGIIDVRVTAADTGNLTVADVFVLTIAPSGGTAGNDTLIGTSGNDVIDGLAGDDVLQGLAGNDILIGGLGNDLLDGGLGADTMTGGPGNDTYVVDATDDLVTENPNEGTDAVQSSTTYTLSANIENLILTGTAALNGTGNSSNNVLTGNSGANVLTGGAGNDTLAGGAGNDVLDGGTGIDAMSGGAGDDIYIVDNAGDTVTELANEGLDQVQSSVTHTLGANVENLTLTGSAAINGTGNALNNILVGNGANNTLTGGAGNDWLDGGLASDTMVGGTGDDVYVVNQAGDVVTENLNEGLDTVESAITYTLGSNLENLTLSGSSNLNGTGNSLNNGLIGNSGNNQLDGGSGNDTMDGGAGNDQLLGGSGDDRLVGGLGDDTLDAGSGNDLLDGGDGTDILDGGSGDDILLGGAGNDQLTGGSGADQFTGGAGNDTLTGGSGNDLYNFARGDGKDTIIDSDSFSGNQDRAVFDATINPIDLILSRQGNDLRLSVYGTTDLMTIQSWYNGTANQVETLQAGNRQHLLNTQVNQLIQAMAGFTTQTGLTWDQGIAQRPQEVQTVLAASWH